MAVVNPQLPWLAQKDFQPNNAVAQTIVAGLQFAQQQKQQELQRQQLAMQQQVQTLKADMLKNQADGTVALGSIMSEATANGSWTNPATRSKVYALTTKYPWLVESELYKGAIQSFDNADKAQAQLNEINQRFALDLMKPEPATADVKNINQLTAWKQELAVAEAAGSLEEAEALKDSISQLEQQMLPSGQTIETYGPDGQLASRITTGRSAAGKEAGALTVGTTTDLQKRLIGFEKANSMSRRLLETLGPLDVGVAGWGQQVLVNEGLAQVFPGMASQSTTDARSLMGTFNETMIKTLKADAQVNQKEEQRILAVLPKPGPNESFPSAISKIIRAMREIHSMSSVDAQKLNQPAPKFPLAPEEIYQLYKSGKLQDFELAKDLLNTYYPDYLKNWKAQQQPTAQP